LEKLSATVSMDGNNATVTFTTDHFTEYALVYTETGSSSVPGTGTSTNNNSSNTTTGTGTNTGTGTGTGTNTGTGSNGSANSYINNGKSAGEDMPKTGDAETYRTILFTLGGLIIGIKLILSVTGKKPARVTKKRRR